LAAACWKNAVGNHRLTIISEYFHRLIHEQANTQRFRYLSQVEISDAHQVKYARSILAIGETAASPLKLVQRLSEFLECLFIEISAKVGA
jgi:hypothetical protein